jgi:hypothetical protein
MLWLISFGLFFLFISLGIIPFLSGNSFAGVSLRFSLMNELIVAQSISKKFSQLDCVAFVCVCLVLRCRVLFKNGFRLK